MRLEIKDLRVHYGKIEAIKGISVTVNQGEIVTLIGALPQREHWRLHRHSPGLCPST